MLLSDFGVLSLGHEAALDIALDKTDKLPALRELILWGWDTVNKMTMDKMMSDSDKGYEEMSGVRRGRGGISV